MRRGGSVESSDLGHTHGGLRFLTRVMSPAVSLGLAASVLYAAAAVLVIRSDRRSRGSWISFAGLASRFATFPVAALTEAFGLRLDHRSNVQMTVAVLATAALIVAGIVALAALLGA